MLKTPLALIAALLVVGITPAFAKEDCNAGYRGLSSERCLLT